MRFVHALKVSKLYQFVTLPGRVQWLYLNAALWLIAVKIGLHLLPFNRLRGWLARPGQPNEKPVTIEEMHEIVLAIKRVGRVLAPLRINCLPQALVGHRLLRHQGFEVRLKIGVLKNHGDQISAHAWLEYQGQVILGDLKGLEQFAVFPSLEVTQR
jgi:hypothetical protein